MNVSRLRTLYIVALAAFGVVTAGNTLMAAQNTGSVQVTIRRGVNAIDDAVRIVGFRLDGSYYDLVNSRASSSINTTSGWMERLEIDVKNISPKTFIAGTIRVECPSANHDPRDHMIIGDFTLGIVPDRFRSPSSPPRASLDATKSPISVKPGQEISFVLGKDFDRMQKIIPQGGAFPDCTVWPVVFHFSDETMWQPRQFYKPNPNSDRGYIKITPEEFGMVVPAY